VWAPVSLRVSARLGGAEQRVADSLLLMGLAARLWNATLVPAAAGDALLDPACLLVSDDHGALRLGVREPAGWSGVSARQVADVVVQALEPVVLGTRLPDGLAWGNVASALLGVRGVAQGVSGWVVEALTHDRLVGTTAAGGRRRSCCLFYRVPGGGLCADCCLDRVPVRD
jgi:iron complex transport system ATP-binding protein